MNKLRAVLKDVKELLSVISNISKSFLPITFLNSIVTSSIPFVNIIYSYLILDGLVLGYSRQTIIHYVIAMVLFNFVLGIISSFLQKVIQVKSLYIDTTIQARISNKALTLDYAALEKQENMELLHRAKDGSTSHGGIRSFCNTLSQFFNHIVSLIYSIVLLAGLFTVKPINHPNLIQKIYNSPYSVLFLFFLLLVSLLLSFKIMNKINKENYKFFEENVDNNRKFSYFSSLCFNYEFGKDIRIYNMVPLIESEMRTYNKKASISMKRLGQLNGKYTGLTEIINQVIIFLTYVFVGIKAILGIITVGSVLKFVNSLIKFHTSLSQIIASWVQLDIQRQYLQNYTRFLNLENNKYQGSLPIEKRDDCEYEIEFKNVSFHYPNNDELILKDINFKLKVGNKMAIVGPNGAGKTTFIKLLCRLYDPTEGEIVLNGIDIKKYDYREYLDLLSVVFQDFKLFSFNIGQNVATSIKYVEEDVWDVLKQAGVYERIIKMEDRLDTVIYQNDEKGVEISGGEAQKLAIARALYKDAPIVILDEPTSALDPLSEFEIYSKFDHLVNNRTAIYISHRMSSCRFCDHILVFEQGKIVQAGNHESLMKEEKSLYKNMWDAQAKYYA